MAAKFDNVPGKVTAETKYSLTETLHPTEWFGKDAWCRGIIDLMICNDDKALVLDWKTGKVKPDSDQLKLFAAFVFHTHPDINTVSTGFIWLKEGRITKEKYERSDLSDIWKGFLPRVRRVEMAFEEDKWEAKPSGLCRNWCPVGKQNCGHCGK